MATIRGHEGILKMEAQGTTAETVLNLTSYTLDTTQDTIETTSMGLAGTSASADVPQNTTGRARTYTKGLMTYTGSADFQFDATNPQNQNVAPLNVFSDTASQTASIELFPEGTTGGDIKATGLVIVTGFSITASVDGIVTGSLTFQGHGDLVSGTV